MGTDTSKAWLASRTPQQIASATRDRRDTTAIENLRQVRNTLESFVGDVLLLRAPTPRVRRAWSSTQTCPRAEGRREMTGPLRDDARPGASRATCARRPTGGVHGTAARAREAPATTRRVPHG